MSILAILKKAAVYVEQKQNPLFSFSVEKQKKILDSIPDPKDSIDRSWSQYRCQMKLHGAFVSSLMNIVSLPFLLKILASPHSNNKKYLDAGHKTTAVFFRDGKPANIAPRSLLNQYAEVITNPAESRLFSKTDKAYVLQLIRRHPLSWHWLFKCAAKISRYHGAIAMYSPCAFIVCNEYSFTSSVLTDYLEQVGIAHVNVMHGEKLYYIRDSFFKFTKCYVWSEAYSHLFEQLRADPSQFIVGIPASILFDIEDRPQQQWDYTYYLGGETKQELMSICSYMTILRREGYRINIRPHPRYTNLNLLEGISKEINIENPQVIDIEHSVLASKNVIAGYSTVLRQAMSNGVQIVIDDMTNPERFQKLSERRFTMLDSPHTLLSSLIGKQ